MNVFNIRREIERLQGLHDECIRIAKASKNDFTFRDQIRLATDFAAKIRNLRAVARDLGEPA